jgi:hypothetical protein
MAAGLPGPESGSVAQAGPTGPSAAGGVALGAAAGGGGAAVSACGSSVVLEHPIRASVPTMATAAKPRLVQAVRDDGMTILLSVGGRGTPEE